MKLIDVYPTLNLDEELVISLTVRELLELHACHSECPGSSANSYCYENLDLDWEEIDSGRQLYNEIKDVLRDRGINFHDKEN